MKKIGEVVIFGTTFKVYITDLSERELAGESSHVEKWIKVCYHQTAESLVSTFWHEVFHMVLALSGQREGLRDGHEEGIVLAMENGLAALLLPLSVPQEKEQVHPKKGLPKKYEHATMLIYLLERVNGLRRQTEESEPGVQGARKRRSEQGSEMVGVNRPVKGKKGRAKGRKRTC